MTKGVGQASGHQMRFYIVLTTLVIGAIFLLLVMNDKSSDGLTSFAVLKSDAKATPETDLAEKAITKKAPEVTFELAFDEVPDLSLNDQAKVKNVLLSSHDLATKIYVNADRLELTNLDAVNLEIGDFEGMIVLDQGGISMDGSTRRLKVNGVTLASRGTIQISFKDLQYEQFVLANIQLKNGISFPTGSGELKVADKLTYSLDQDQLKADYFEGRIATAEEGISVEGVASGVQVSGALLNFDLK